jgi:hypothetical protein
MRTLVLRWLLAVAGPALVVVLILYLVKVSPRIVLDARSHAVVFVPADTIDLVRLASPRHGLEAGGVPFTGIRFADTLPGDVTLESFMESPPTDGLHSLQRFDVTPECTVRLEHYVDKVVRLDIEGPAMSGDCWMSAAFTLAGGSRRPRELDPRPVKFRAPVTLVFEPLYPLHLRNIPVSQLRFETSDTGFVRSSIIAATLELPEIDRTGPDAVIAYLGDAVRLGRVEGHIAEIVVADTIRTLFKGSASRPRIEEQKLRPTSLEYLSHHPDFRLGIVVIVTALTLVAAIYQAIK